MGKIMLLLGGSSFLLFPTLLVYFFKFMWYIAGAETVDPTAIALSALLFGGFAALVLFVACVQKWG
jgi:hypothetical protein